MLLIRRYQNSDYKDLIKLHVSALQNTNAYITKKDYYKDLEDINEIYLNACGEFLVGFLKEKLIAMGAFRMISKDRVELKRMRIHPDFQKRGFGQLMLNELESRAKNLEYIEIELFTSVRQIGAQHFYLKNGYHEVKRGKEDRPLENIFYLKAI